MQEKLQKIYTLLIFFPQDSNTELRLPQVTVKTCGKVMVIALARIVFPKQSKTGLVKIILENVLTNMGVKVVGTGVKSSGKTLKK